VSFGSSAVTCSGHNWVVNIEVVSPNENVVAADIPAGLWHTVNSLESGTIIMESKDGVYRPTGLEDKYQ
jgi:hypothetical protein